MRKCPCVKWTNVVVGRGANLKAPLMFMGGPGEQEDIEDMPLWGGQESSWTLPPGPVFEP